MTTPSAQSLELAEDRLQQALRDRDVDGLNSLLDPDAIFVGPDGSQVDKDSDLETYRSGQLTLTGVTELARASMQFDSTGLTRVRLHLVGAVQGAPLDVTLTYTRTWRFIDGSWRVLQAHGSIES